MPPLRAPRFAIRSYDATSAAHAHDHAQVVLPLQGALELTLGEHGGEVVHDVAALIPPGLTHAFRARAANRFVVLDLDAAVRTSPGARFFPVSRSLSHLLRYVQTLGVRAAPDVRAHAAALLSDAVRRSLAERESAVSGPLRRALVLLHERIAAPLRVAELAEAAGMSTSHLHAEFRRQLGKSPARYHADLRLDAALQRLRSSDEPIAEVALACGYSEQSALTRALRRRHGITPAAARRS